MKIFELDEQFSVVCNWKKTRNGFKHEASLMKNGREIDKVKCCYLNRTWERYEFQSVLHKIINKCFKEDRVQELIDKVDGKTAEEEKAKFSPVKFACAIGDILCSTEEEKNNWKKRMLGTVPGIEFPEEFDGLPEEEKKRRLDEAAKIL